MKYLVFLIILSLGFVACKKDLGACKDYKEVNGPDQSIDVSTIDFKSYRDTLDKYPQLKPYRYTSDQYSKNLFCNMYYNNLLIFSDVYSMYKSNSADSIQKNGDILKTPLTISLDPSIPHDKAIDNAKKFINFDYTCITYRLGIYHVNRGSPGYDSYRLAWKIASSDNANRYVISDANSNALYEINGGIYYIN